MKIEIRSLTLLVCAALALISCTQKPHDPEPENIPIGFRPMSQAVWVKSDPKPLSDFHSDFGVWGIARHSEISSPYILWTSDDLTQVTKNNAANAPANQYIPTEDAYWLSGYTYNFIAIAPYTDSGLSNVNIVQTEESTSNAPDAMSFTFSLANKYEPSAASTPKVYDFDLMGAAAETQVSKASTQGAQPITFWHLLSQINIEVVFGNDTNGSPVTGTVTQMRLCNVDSETSYTITFKDDNSMDIIPSLNTATEKDLLFTNSQDESKWLVTANVVPQNIEDLELYMDFTANNVTYTDFKVNLSIGVNNPIYYSYNQRYNWKINIGPSLFVSFSAIVTPWDDNEGAGYDADDEIEF